MTKKQKRQTKGIYRMQRSDYIRTEVAGVVVYTFKSGLVAVVGDHQPRAIKVVKTR